LNDCAQLPNSSRPSTGSRVSRSPSGEDVPQQREVVTQAFLGKEEVELGVAAARAAHDEVMGTRDVRSLVTKLAAVDDAPQSRWDLADAHESRREGSTSADTNGEEAGTATLVGGEKLLGALAQVCRRDRQVAPSLPLARSYRVGQEAVSNDEVGAERKRSGREAHGEHEGDRQAPA
jgi:hypothetical protein